METFRIRSVMEGNSASNSSISDAVDEIIKGLMKEGGKENAVLSDYLYVAAELRNIFKLGKGSSYGNLSSCTLPMTSNSQGRCLFSSCPFQGRKEMNEPLEKGRYLCVSDGFMICCMDLKHEAFGNYNSCSRKQMVPHPIETPKWPALGFVFSLGGQSYVVRGEEVLEDPKLKVYSFFHLSLVDGKLYETRCDNMKPLQRLYFKYTWPIVERIGDEIHMFESFPSLRYFAVASHAALDLKDPCRGWIEDGPMRIPWGSSDGANFPNLIVLGDRLYAGHWSRPNEFAEYKLESNTWKVVNAPRGRSLLRIRHVAQILQFGSGGWIGEYVNYGSETRLYVFLAIESEGNIPVAFLVTPKGRVVCCQPLFRFFVGFEQILKQHVQGTVTSYDQVWCAIVREYDRPFLQVATFTWEPVLEALDLVAQLGEQIKKDDFFENLTTDGDDSVLNQEIFIDVNVKGCWYVPSTPLRASCLTACFL